MEDSPDNAQRLFDNLELHRFRALGLNGRVGQRLTGDLDEVFGAVKGTLDLTFAAADGSDASAYD